MGAPTRRPPNGLRAAILLALWWSAIYSTALTFWDQFGRHASLINFLHLHIGVINIFYMLLLFGTGFDVIFYMLFLCGISKPQAWILISLCWSTMFRRVLVSEPFGFFILNCGGEPAKIWYTTGQRGQPISRATKYSC